MNKIRLLLITMFFVLNANYSFAIDSSNKVSLSPAVHSKIESRVMNKMNENFGDFAKFFRLISLGHFLIRYDIDHSFIYSKMRFTAPNENPVDMEMFILVKHGYKIDIANLKIIELYDIAGLKRNFKNINNILLSQR